MSRTRYYIPLGVGSDVSVRISAPFDSTVATRALMRVYPCATGARSYVSSRAFTLIELMAAVLVIVIVAGIALGVVGYVQRRVAVASTKAQIAALEAALESYKSDWGYYPASTRARISSSGFSESTNNFILYRALSGVAGRRYMSFPARQLQLSIGSGSTNATSSGGLTNFCDPWGTPYNYYCSPTTAAALSNNFYGYPTNVNYNNGCSVGGQINVTTFDVFSYGPDKVTFVAPMAYGSGSAPGIIYYGWWGDGPWNNLSWSYTNSARDDITNWGK